MATSKKPRKRYHKKVMARPLTNDQRERLELAARIHIHKLWNGTLDELGWNTIAAHLNVCVTLAGDDRFDPAMEALESIRQRQRKVGSYGATGDERKIIMDKFNDAVQFMGSRTDKQITSAVTAVYRMCA